MPKASGMVSWKALHNGDSWNRTARKLKEQGRGDLQRKLTKAVRREGKPALAAVQEAWRGIDVGSERGGGKKSTGLRDRAARATRLQVRATGIRITTNAKKVDPNYPNLVRYLNGQGRWRHPVFGRDVWRTNTGTEVFFPTLVEFAPAWRAEIVKAMEEIVREIEG